MWGPLPWGRHVENWTAFTFLDESSGEKFECFKIARSSNDILLTLSDAQEPNPISKLTKDDVKDWTGVNKDTFAEEEFTDEQLIYSVLNPEMPLVEEQYRQVSLYTISL